MNSPLKNDAILQGGGYSTANVSGGTAFRLPMYSNQGSSAGPMFGPAIPPMFRPASPINNNVGVTNPLAGANDPSAMQQFQMAQGIGGIFQGLFGRKKRRTEQSNARIELENRQKAYEDQDYANLAGGMKNQFAGMENTYEDLTVNQQQAQFQSQQNQQSQGNIMQNLRGAAGSSGIAGLAQALANQSQIATQKASASIGLQESKNQQLSAQGQAGINMAEAKGQASVDVYKLQGANAARTLENNRIETLYGMAMKRKGRADQAIQSANAALMGGIGSLATSYLTGGMSGMAKPDSFMGKNFPKLQ